MAPFFRLFFALLPPPRVAAEVGWLRDTLGCQRRPVDDDRLHMTFLRLGDFEARPSGLVAHLQDLMPAIALPACRILLDRVIFDAKAARLVASERLPRLHMCQRALRHHLIRAGLVLPHRGRFSPHMTLHYDSNRVGAAPIDAVSWTAEELVLIESIVTRHRHIAHGRWPLKSVAAPASQR